MKPRIAIIGAGISGLGAAWALRETADITVFEADDRPGGHACTHHFDYDGRPMSVDLGFIVYNALNYPNLVAFFDALGIETQPSDMSFALSDPDGWEWASTASGLFAQRSNLVSLRFHSFWQTILRFNDTARRELSAGEIGNATLCGWLDKHAFPESFRNNYILPMGAAIWSTPEARILEYPAQSFFQFFDNHRLMHKERPKWRTVRGGSKNYVEAVATALGDRLLTGCGAARVRPFGEKTAVELASGRTELFDDVILAVHSDQALELIESDYEQPAFLLRSVRYRPNTIYLHSDQRLMPKRRTAWASWNVLKQEGDDVCVTYWMNRLQRLDPDRPLFITLNPAEPPAAERTFLQYTFDHPQFDAAAEAAVRSLKRIQGHDGLWFAGAWMGRGFHEDGLISGLSAALSLGGSVPWRAEGVELANPDRTSTPTIIAKGASA